MENHLTANKITRQWLWLGIVAVLVIIVGFKFYLLKKSLGILGQDIKLVVYTKSGNTTGGIISVPYVKDYNQTLYASAGVDLNGNDKFSKDEWLIKNIPIIPTKDWVSNLAFKASKNLSGRQKVRVVVNKAKFPENSFEEFVEGDDSKVADIEAVNEQLDNLFGTEISDSPEESMKQGSAANTPVKNQALSQVPDFRQRPAECAPTVAANGLYSLAFKKGAGDKLPENPQDMIDGLKEDLKWTYKNGVLPDDFVAGKNKYAVTHGLPIKTEKIGDKDGRGTLEDIKKALQNGSAVEMRIRFADANLKAVGGHIVSVVAVREEGGNTFIDIHDPASPTGTDTYQVSANSILNYPYHDGDTVIGWGFSQTWQGAPMGGQLDAMTEAELQGIREFTGEKKTIKALNVNGKYIPLTEVRIGKGEHCDGPKEQFPHWHSINGIGVTTTDGSKLPDNEGCGYGKEKDVPVVDVQVP